MTSACLPVPSSQSFAGLVFLDDFLEGRAVFLVLISSDWDLGFVLGFKTNPTRRIVSVWGLASVWVPSGRSLNVSEGGLCSQTFADTDRSWMSCSESNFHPKSPIGLRIWEGWLARHLLLRILSQSDSLVLITITINEFVLPALILLNQACLFLALGFVETYMRQDSSWSIDGGLAGDLVTLLGYFKNCFPF